MYAPCGWGKTRVTGAFVAWLLRQVTSVLIAVPTKVLGEQMTAALSSMIGNVVFCKDSSEPARLDPSAWQNLPVVVVTHKTLQEKAVVRDVVIIDEAHRMKLDAIRHIGALKTLLVTATPADDVDESVLVLYRKKWNDAGAAIFDSHYTPSAPATPWEESHERRDVETADALWIPDVHGGFLEVVEGIHACTATCLLYPGVCGLPRRAQDDRVALWDVDAFR